MNIKYEFLKQDLDHWNGYALDYLVDMLNGEYDLNEAREDLLSLVAQVKEICPSCGSPYKDMPQGEIQCTSSECEYWV